MELFVTLTTERKAELMDSAAAHDAKLEALEAAGREARDAYDHEHVTPFLYHHPERFTQGELVQDRDESALRWTVDTPEDFAFTLRVYEALYPAKPDFTSDDIRALPFAHYEPDA